MQKGISIYFSPEDLAELQEFVVWKTHKAAGFASVESEFDLRTAADLIKRSQLEKAHRLQQIESERGSQRALEEQRENVSLLPDSEAEKIQHEWIEQGKLQAQSYAEARNRSSQPRATQGIDSDILQSTLSWIRRTKMRGGLGGRRGLDKT